MAQVDLICTSFNTARYLPDCLESVLAQHYRDFNLLIMDDGSTDNSAAIAEMHSRTDSRIDFYKAPGHIGRKSCLQTLHRLVTAPYVGWVDSDDLLAPNALEASLSAIEDFPAVTFTYSDFCRIDEQGTITSIHKGKQYQPHELLDVFRTKHFRLIRTASFWEAGGINPELEYGIDYDLTLRLSELGPFTHVPEVLYAYRKREGCISASKRVLQSQCCKKAVEEATLRRRSRYACDSPD